MKSIKFQPAIPKENGFVLIAGPCSAETEEQVLTTAQALQKQNIDVFRAGVWKPRTRPNSFEGVGTIGLTWLNKVQQQFNMKVTTEVANAKHVEEALKHNIDILWIGARTAVNPFAVQEIADALNGVDIPVLVKNPINPDLKLWIGAIERIYNAGIRKIAAVHRGFSCLDNSGYRNNPIWEIPIRLRKEYPDIQLICDNSHICGKRSTLQKVAKRSINFDFNGVMTEVHHDPNQAWSDASQQITPQEFRELLLSLNFKSNKKSWNAIDFFRDEIDDIDNEFLNLLNKRMNLVKGIGNYKTDNKLSIIQKNRLNTVFKSFRAKGASLEMSEQFIFSLFQLIHKESVEIQKSLVRQTREAS